MHYTFGTTTTVLISAPFEARTIKRFFAWEQKDRTIKPDASSNREKQHRAHQQPSTGPAQ